MLPCGCARCGCLCEEHDPERLGWRCFRHGRLMSVLHGAAEFFALALVIAAIAAWA